MSFEHYIVSGGEKLRCGYTTGSCAALASKAAARTLLSGQDSKTESLVTPKGLSVEVDILDLKRGDGWVSCAVRKDGGDDIDATDGALIYAEVSKTPVGIEIDGGKGVGRVSLRGLDQPVGHAAINSVPRRMIKDAAEEVCRKYAYEGGFKIIISVPQGEEIAKRTLNRKLGIEGGISILGTSGIVEPQSLEALVASIEIELRVIGEKGEKNLIVTPGNYGENFLSTLPELEGFPLIKCSNFFGDTLDFAAQQGMENVLMVSHMGKLVKLAGGIMNTHSRFADCRTELFAAHAALSGASRFLVEKIMASPTSDACIELLDSAGLRDKVMESLLYKIQEHLSHRSGGAYAVGAIAFSNKFGLLGMTEGGREILEKWRDKA
ncbi:MAG: cobalamin biosynthesis protein CbiD [Clostridiales bacterium]|nr:cobalamin biosynthesis protein CbiD [Clostridiales bacterium]